MSIFNGDTEKEVSSGAMIGYVLIGFAIVVVIAFLIFVGIKKVSGNNENTAIVTEESVEVSTDTEDNTTK